MIDTTKINIGVYYLKHTKTKQRAILTVYAQDGQYPNMALLELPKMINNNRIIMLKDWNVTHKLDDYVPWTGNEKQCETM